MFRPLVITLCALAGATQACTEMSFHPKDLLTGLRVPGKACSLEIWGKRFERGETAPFVVEKAEDQGGGIVAQHMGESYDCESGHKAIIVTDCSNANAVQVQGWESGYLVSIEIDENGVSKVVPSGPRAFVEAAKATGIDIAPGNLSTFAAAQAEEFSVTLHDVTIAKRSDVLGRRVDLACACRHFYPQSTGAKK